MRLRRRGIEIFSISFLDCMCCGFGAVLLLFVLTAGKKEEERERHLAQIKEVVGRLETDVTERQERIQKLARQRDEDEAVRRDLEPQNATKEVQVTELERTLAILLQQQSTLEDEMRRLMEEKAAIPTVPERPPLPIPNIQRQQYLTGFKLDGRHVLFLVRASGSMVAETLEEAIALQGEPDEVRRATPKWQRVVRSIEWLIASLPSESTFQILLFNDETFPLDPAHPDRWVERNDTPTIRDLLEKLRNYAPHGGANLERAFFTVRRMHVVPDSVILLTDGLPTKSDSLASPPVVTDSDRMRFFRAAARVVPRDIPINTLLYPFSGDPVAPFLFWQLAADTRGALVSPAPSWPDTL
jgi:hypothetical protein